MAKELYSAIVVFSETYIKTQVGVVNNNSVCFTDFNFKVDLINIHNDYVQFKFYDEYLKYYINDKPHKHLAGFFGIRLDNPLWVKPVSLFDGETTAVLMDCYIVFSQFPIDIDSINKTIGLVMIEGRIPNLESVQEQLRAKNRVNEFLEMMDYCDSDYRLAKSTKQLIKNTRVYRDDFVSKKEPKRHGNISFEENLTLLSAERFLNTGKKIAVLNFANPVEPGGGVLRGAKAQEEYLCRSSNLYKSLTSKNAEEYYIANNSIRSGNQFNSMFIGTDQVIYSPDVMILKTVDFYRKESLSDYKEIYAKNNYTVDVLTCAAPFFSGSGYIIPNGDLKYIMMRRIKNIFEAAVENDIEVLILGAFGCGAFHNPPEVVADAFRECLMMQKYIKAFDEVVFSIKRDAFPSKNIEMFERDFSNFPYYNEDGHERYISKHLRDYRYR